MTAPDDGNYKVSSSSLDVTCLRCGVHIGNRVIHDRWHVRPATGVAVEALDLSALLNVVALAIARGEVGPNDAPVRDAYRRCCAVMADRLDLAP